MSLKLDTSKQEEIIKYIDVCHSEYKELLSPYYDRLLEIYKEANSFTAVKTSPRDTTFKVNKCHEVKQKVLPRIISRNPTRLVSNKPDHIVSIINNQGIDEQAKITTLEDQKKYAEMVQKLLTTIFDKYGLSEQVRMWASDMITYGKGISKAKFKYEVARTLSEEEGVDITYDDNGEPIETPYKNKKKDYIWGEHPCIDTVSWANIYYDPRYKDFDDVPAIVEITDGVRLSQIKNNKEYINTDMLDALPPKSMFSDNNSLYMELLRAVTGINNITLKEGVDKDNLTLKTYYGYYDLGKGEGLYKFTVASGVVLICAEEILQMPFEQIRCFEDSETNLGYGFLEPILSLQRELNFKKNSASKYINNSLNRSWILGVNAGINPKDLISRPNNIIMTTKDIASVQNNMMEVPHREINGSYFNEQNDFERQIQAMTFTVDTSSPNSQQGLTNTATGARIKFFESNTVMDEVRKHLEEGLSRIAYKLLNEIFENMGEMDNMILPSKDDKEFLLVHREAIKDSIKKYDIKIEAGSSSYDTIENRRDDAIAKYNLGLQAKGAGVNVDLEKMFLDVLNTFETKDAEGYIVKQPMMDMGMGAGQPLPMQEGGMPVTAGDLTQQVAQGGLTSGVQ